MDTNKRKFFSRVGAGLMLGLSLFNLGAAIGKNKVSEVPARARQIRRRETEQIKPEAQLVANIAQQEAKVVLMEQQQLQEETQLKIQTEELSGFQLVLRFVAVGVWAVSAGVFFSSMIFNIPFALGNVVLSLLPGIPHVASLSLSSSDSVYNNQEPIKIQLRLDSNQEKVSFAKALVQYDPKTLEFYRYEATNEKFSQLNSQEKEAGVVELFLDNAAQPGEFKDEVIATLYFHPQDTALGPHKVVLNKDQSVVLKNDKKEGSQNILGKVSAASFVLTYPDQPEVLCRKIDFLADSLSSWQDFAKGTILPQEKNYWVALEEERSLLCAYQDQKIYLIFNGKIDDQLEKLSYFIEDKEAVSPIRVDAVWQEETQKFQVLAVEQELKETQRSFIKIIFQDKNGNKISWPPKGKGALKIE